MRMYAYSYVYERIMFIVICALICVFHIRFYTHLRGVRYGNIKQLSDAKFHCAVNDSNVSIHNSTVQEDMLESD